MVLKNLWAGTVLVLLATLVAPLEAASAGAASPEGVWLTEDRRGVIRITRCGMELCGRIAGMAEFPTDGSVPRDFQGRPQCGLEIIHAVVPVEPGEWNATITDPENGNLYGARLSVEADGRLRLRGFLRVPLLGSALGSTQLWTAYAGTLDGECRMGG